MTGEKLDLILSELQSINSRVSALEMSQDNIAKTLTTFATKEDLKPFATKDDLKPIYDELTDLKYEQQQIKQAVLETNEDVKEIKRNHTSITQIVGEHEISIRSIKNHIL